MLPRGHGEKIAIHLERAKALERLNIAARQLQDRSDEDRWLFGSKLDGCNNMRSCK